MPTQLETNIEKRKLKELLETQEWVRNTYQSQECKEWIMRALKGKIREHEIVLGTMERVYYKKVGEDKFR